jgi:hypothetical protein
MWIASHILMRLKRTTGRKLQAARSYTSLVRPCTDSRHVDIEGPRLALALVELLHRLRNVAPKLGSALQQRHGSCMHVFARVPGQPQIGSRRRRFHLPQPPPSITATPSHFLRRRRLLLRLHMGLIDPSSSARGAGLDRGGGGLVMTDEPKSMKEVMRVPEASAGQRRQYNA